MESISKKAVAGTKSKGKKYSVLAVPDETVHRTKKADWLETEGDCFPSRKDWLWNARIRNSAYAKMSKKKTSPMRTSQQEDLVIQGFRMRSPAG